MKLEPTVVIPVAATNFLPSADIAKIPRGLVVGTILFDDQETPELVETQTELSTIPAYSVPSADTAMDCQVLFKPPA